MNIKIKLDPKFFEEEIRNDYKISSEMKKVWAVELDLLVELDRVCKKYDIKYWLEGGTLLGAIRHNGFIPWDDDIDVGMLRPDYDKLINIALTTNEFKHPYFLQCAYNDDGYARGHAQLRNSETTAILNMEKDSDIKFNQGIFIDIFVFDTIPDDENERITQLKFLKKAGRSLFRFYNPCFIGQEHNRVKKLIKKLYRDVFKIGHNLKKDYGKIEKYLTDGYNKGQNVDAILFRMRNNKHLIPKDVFEKIINCKFEQFDFPIVEKYDTLLTYYYGKDYINPKKIPTMHSGVIFDTDKSYKNYINKGKGEN